MRLLSIGLEAKLKRPGILRTPPGPHSTKTGTNCSGTCAMKDREADGVVDRMLNVYGTKKLKVVGIFSQIEMS